MVIVKDPVVDEQTDEAGLPLAHPLTSSWGVSSLTTIDTGFVSLLFMTTLFIVFSILE